MKKMSRLQGIWETRLRQLGLGEKLCGPSKEEDLETEFINDDDLNRTLRLIARAEDPSELENDEDVLYLQECMKSSPRLKKSVIARAEKKYCNDPEIMERVNSFLPPKRRG